MAVLMVVGISLARRPASSVLPPPQQTRALEPGGVTLTTHPAATTAKAPAQQMHRAAAPSHPSPAPAQRSAHRAVTDNEGPDVVTHYYNARQKPSPVKQTTVAGVRHYSDM